MWRSHTRSLRCLIFVDAFAYVCIVQWIETTNDKRVYAIHFEIAKNVLKCICFVRVNVNLRIKFNVRALLILKSSPLSVSIYFGFFYIFHSHSYNRIDCSFDSASIRLVFVYYLFNYFSRSLVVVSYVIFGKVVSPPRAHMWRKEVFFFWSNIRKISADMWFVCCFTFISFRLFFLIVRSSSYSSSVAFFFSLLRFGDERINYERIQFRILFALILHNTLYLISRIGKSWQRSERENERKNGPHIVHISHWTFYCRKPRVLFRHFRRRNWTIFEFSKQRI